MFTRPRLVMVQSRQGADLTAAFPDIAAAAVGLGEALVLDGELVVPYEGRVHFAQLQRQARLRAATPFMPAVSAPRT
ncbi:hypothetical protein [Streptomyces sp. IBSBF 2507]|uniref:hypothetical protein n=1 Tax=Streptomyces sp. IBSBF 2507 TaxID=2903530 RepID=UPI00351F64B7